jgi:hypothetical protein
LKNKKIPLQIFYPLKFDFKATLTFKEIVQKLNPRERIGVFEIVPSLRDVSVRIHPCCPMARPLNALDSRGTGAQAEQ